MTPAGATVRASSQGGIEVDHLQFGSVGLAGGTTTTVPAGGCDRAPTYASILCRLDALVTDVGAATDLGCLKRGLLGAATKARKQARKAADTAKSKTAKTQLKKCARSLDAFRHKLDSNNAKTIVPAAIRDGFREVANAIKTDATALRGTLS